MNRLISSSHQDLLDIDFLVYSSHKSGTQTILSTLKESAQTCRHLHTLANVGLSENEGEFSAYLEHYLCTRNKPLTIISTFRDPLQRHISSFFQWHGLGAVRSGIVKCHEDTVIARLSIPELSNLFVSQLECKKLIGYRDSLHQLCREVDLPVSEVQFNSDRQHGRTKTRLMELITFRFDRIFSDYPRILELALNLKLHAVSTNKSSDHWYHQKYYAFKNAIKLPKTLIADIYEAKRDLIAIFYPGQFDSMVRKAESRYGQ
jgi:hypothetical protein